MYMMARIYPNTAQASAAADAFVAAGYNRDDVAMLASQTSAAAPEVSSTEADTEGETQMPSSGPSADDMANAVRVGRMLGSNADFYMAELTGERCLLVATPPFIASGKAEAILDKHSPLDVSHLPPKEKFVPVSEKAAPFSSALGLPVLSHGGPLFSNLLGFKSKQEGLSHFSRWFPPLSSDFWFSNKLGMKTLTDSPTPLSSMIGYSTKSGRLEGKASTFGMSFKAERDTPFSSLLGIPVLAERKFFLTSE